MNKCSLLDRRNSEETSETSASLVSQILHDSLSSLSGAGKVRWPLHVKKDVGSNKHVEFYEVLVNEAVSNICLLENLNSSSGKTADITTSFFRQLPVGAPGRYQHNAVLSVYFPFVT